MKLTLKNIWDNKELFIQKCKEGWACKDEFKRLLNAKSKDDFMEVVWDNYNWVNRMITEEYDYAWCFYEGFALVKLNDKYGFIDEAGNIFIPIIYDFASNFFEGLAKVKSDNKYGFIDKNGYIIVPIIYDYASNSSEGLAVAQLNDKCGFIDKNGNVVVPIIYDYAFSFNAGSALVKLDKECFRINQYNERVGEWI